MSPFAFQCCPHTTIELASVAHYLCPECEARLRAAEQPPTPDNARREISDVILESTEKNLVAALGPELYAELAARGRAATEKALAASSPPTPPAGRGEDEETDDLGVALNEIGRLHAAVDARDAVIAGLVKAVTLLRGNCYCNLMPPDEKCHSCRVGPSLEAARPFTKETR